MHNCFDKLKKKPRHVDLDDFLVTYDSINTGLNNDDLPTCAKIPDIHITISRTNHKQTDYTMTGPDVSVEFELANKLKNIFIEK